MPSRTNGKSSKRFIRIQDDEKELLSRLHEIYGNDYKKYIEYIRRESHISVATKKTYRLLDERQAYRRIVDYFHRQRLSNKIIASQSINNDESHTCSSTREISPVSVKQKDHEMNDEDDNNRQQSISPELTDGDDEFNETNDDERIPSPLINTPEKQILSVTNNQQPPISQSTITLKPDLLSVRSIIQKALCELDRTIITKNDALSYEEYDNEQHEHHRCSTKENRFSINDYPHEKLDDIVRSLSNVVNQQQENTRLIVNDTSVLLLDNDKQSSDPIKNVLQRLNSLIDRGDSINDKIERILSEF